MSVKHLLGTVTFLAIGCAASKQASTVWMVFTVTSMFMALMYFSVSALTRSGRSKTFARGFCIGGWLYMALLLLGFEHTLATTWASQSCFRFVSAEKQTEPTYQGGWHRDEGDVIYFSGQVDTIEAGEEAEAKTIFNGPTGGGMGRRRGNGGYGGGYGGAYGGGGGGGGYGRPAPPYLGSYPMLTPYARYMHITHCMWTILLATACGALATLRDSVAD